MLDQYKPDTDTEVCCTPTFKHDQSVYIENPSLDTSSTFKAKGLATINYNKIMSREMGPLVIDSVQPNSRFID